MRIEDYQRQVAGSGHTYCSAPCAVCGDIDGCHRDKIMSIYVASSWRNDTQPEAVAALKRAGFRTYDFRGHGGFKWSDIDVNWRAWGPDEYLRAMQTDRARAGFERDLDAMKRADACLMVQPCGVSAALETGWFAGRNKPVAVLLSPIRFEPDLMFGLAGSMHTDIAEAIKWFRAQSVLRRDRGR